MTTTSIQTQGRSESVWAFLLIFAVVVGLWGAYWAWIANHYPPGDDAEKAQAMRGQFGDMFGAVNALFSAMAFAVLCYTMFLQRTELRLQREELKETRAELARTASAQEKSEQALTQQVQAMEQFARAAYAQVDAMVSLANVTRDQANHERELASASRHQAEALKEVSRAINNIQSKFRQ